MPALDSDTTGVREHYRRLRDALPCVRFHCVPRMESDPATIDAIVAEDGCFAAQTPTQLAALLGRGVRSERIIYTGAVATRAEIGAMVASGIRTFVVGTAAESARFVRFRARVRLLVSIEYADRPSAGDPHAGPAVRATEPTRLIERALRHGVDVVGFRFDVGDRAETPVPFCTAVYETLTLMGELERRLPVRFEVLDIGGVPDARGGEATGVEEIAACIRPMLAVRSTQLDIVAEFRPAVDETVGEARR